MKEYELALIALDIVCVCVLCGHKHSCRSHILIESQWLAYFTILFSWNLQQVGCKAEASSQMSGDFGIACGRMFVGIQVDILCRDRQIHFQEMHEIDRHSRKLWRNVFFSQRVCHCWSWNRYSTDRHTKTVLPKNRLNSQSSRAYELHNEWFRMSPKTDRKTHKLHSMPSGQSSNFNNLLAWWCCSEMFASSRKMKNCRDGILSFQPIPSLSLS